MQINTPCPISPSLGEYSSIIGVAERIQPRAHFLEEKFSRGSVNRGFRCCDHRRLM